MQIDSAQFNFISILLKKTRLHPYFFLENEQFLKLFETCKSIDPQSKFISKRDTFAEKKFTVNLLFSWKWAIVEVFQNLQIDSTPYFFLKMKHISSFSKTPNQFKFTQSFCQKERCLLKKNKGVALLYFLNFSKPANRLTSSLSLSRKKTLDEKKITVHLLFSWKWPILEVFRKLQIDSTPYFFLENEPFFKFFQTPNRFRSDSRKVSVKKKDVC